MKPVTQIFSLVLEQMKDFKKKRKPFERKVRSLQRKWKDNEKKCDDYIMKERDAHVKKLIFEPTYVSTEHILKKYVCTVYIKSI